MDIKIAWINTWPDMGKVPNRFQHFGHQVFLQGDTIIIDGHGQAVSK